MLFSNQVVLDHGSLRLTTHNRICVVSWVERSEAWTLTRNHHTSRCQAIRCDWLVSHLGHHLIASFSRGLILTLCVFNSACLRLAWLTDSYTLTLSSDLHVGVDLSPNHDIILAELDCVILTSTTLFGYRCTIASHTQLRLDLRMFLTCLDYHLVAIVLWWATILVLTCVDSSEADIYGRCILRPNINIVVLATSCTRYIYWVLVTFLFIIRFNTSPRLIDICIGRLFA